MSITTSPSPAYVLRTAFLAVVCIGLGLWGAYDLWVKIPRKEAVARRYEQASQVRKEYEDARQRGGQPTPQETEAYQRANEELRSLTQGGKIPAPPGQWDRLTQWIFVSCLPFAIWPIVQLLGIRGQRYTLDESGTLHFTRDPKLGAGTWPASAIRDIDMDRWMRKSIAWAVNDEGQRLKLDAYLHKNLELIVGALASRLHHEQWDALAKPIKHATEAEAQPAGTGEAGEQSVTPAP
jgi:hypothetical protein